ncbi:MAG: hypothetical protein K2Y37_07035 [Pirellulales bacterium]|nr:hypothetical protein [Pirellulales bacterium]
MAAGVVTGWLDLAFVNSGGALLSGFNSHWVAVCTDVATADNSGSVVTNPYSITRTSQNWIQLNGLGTTVQFRLQYPVGATVTTSPVIQCFGRDVAGGTASNSRADRLVDPSLAHALTLLVDPSNDVDDGTYKCTQPVEVDANGNIEVIAAVMIALAGTGLSGAQILARVR